MAYFTVTDVTDTSFCFTLADLQLPFVSEHYSNFVLKIDGEIVSMVTPSGVPGGLQTISFYYTDSDGNILVSGESYDISCTVYTVDGNVWNIPTEPNGNIYVETITMLYPSELRPDKAVYDFCKVVRIGNKSLKVSVDFSSIYTRGYLLDYVEVYSDLGTFNFTSDSEKCFYNLSDGMTYTFTFTAFYNGNVPVDDNGDEVLKDVKREIVLFNWTDDELYALENRKAITTITRSRWNELCAYTYDTLGYWGRADNAIGANTYGVDAYASMGWAVNYRTKMTSSDKTLYATKFNILNHCIGQEIGTGITDRVGMTDVENGTATEADKVLGEYFIRLVECLNYK